MSIRADILRSEKAVANGRKAKKKAVKTAGLAEFFDAITGRKTKRKINDILNQDPTRPPADGAPEGDDGMYEDEQDS